MSKSNLENRIKGALYGFAIGDAMGATTEFMHKNEIKRVYGKVDKIIGGGWLKLPAGQVTDDTQMSLCIMKALEKYYGSCGFIREVKMNFIEWYKSKPVDIGCQCSKGIQALIEGHELGKTTNSTPGKLRPLGNGSLMRALPCALVNLPDALDMNIAQGNLTHNDSFCEECIKVYHNNIRNLLEDSSFRTCLYSSELLEPTGHVFHTLNNAIYWSNQKMSFRDCIIGAVNDGGDADTIAAITGSLAGAAFGFDSIPTEWINSLDVLVRNELDEFVEFALKTYEVK